MLQGLRTIVYHVSDLERAKAWYEKIFGIKPYFDEAFYVGFNIGGFELGLDPDPSKYSAGHAAVTYWGVKDLNACFEKLNEMEVKVHEEPNNVGGPIWVGSIYDPFGNVIGLIENPEFKIL